MKKFVLYVIIGCCTLLLGCFETTQEITINKNGTGVFSNTTDLSKVVGMLKQMGGEDAEKMQSKDTTILLKGAADSIPGLTQEQRDIVSGGKMRLVMNVQEEKLLVKLDFPFQKLSDVQMLKGILPSLSVSALKRLPGANQMPSGGGDTDSTKVKTFESYFDDVVSAKVISKTLNKSKYATAGDDELMKSLQQMSGMGSPVKVNYVINLPKKAKKVEGKAATLSSNKKKVTVSVTSDDFFNDPSKFEYRIEY